MPEVIQKSFADPVAFATIILAALTGVLALVTVAAIIVPVVAASRERTSQRRGARHRTSALLSGLENLLQEQMREPAWLLQRPADTLAAAILGQDMLSDLEPHVSRSVTEAVVLAHRTLTAEDRVVEARRSQNQGMFEEIKHAANDAHAAVKAAHALVD